MKHFFFGKSRALHIQFFRYLFVGAVATVADLAVYGLATEAFSIHYLFAAFLGYSFGFLVNHGLSLLWVFESKHSRGHEFALAFLITLGGLFWTELLLWGFVSLFGEHLHFLGRFVVIWIVLFWNFGMRKMFVFH